MNGSEFNILSITPVELIALTVQTISGINFAGQILLGVVLMAGANLAKKRKLETHCGVMRVAVALLLVSTLLVMLPSLLGYLFDDGEQPDGLFTTEMLVHHTLGVMVVILWIYFNLVMAGKMKPVGGRLAPAMRLAFACWVIALLMGIHLYLVIQF